MIKHGYCVDDIAIYLKSREICISRNPQCSPHPHIGLHSRYMANMGMSKPFHLSPMAVFHALNPECMKQFCLTLSGGGGGRQRALQDAGSSFTEYSNRTSLPYTVAHLRQPLDRYNGTSLLRSPMGLSKSDFNGEVTKSPILCTEEHNFGLNKGDRIDR